MLHNPILIKKSLDTCRDYFLNKTNLPKDIIDYILDLTFGVFNTNTICNINKIHNIKSCYEYVLSEMIYKSHPKCGKNCAYDKTIRFYEGEPINLPMIYRSTQQICTKCNYICVSIYGFNTCHECSTESEFPFEFEYYHKICKKNIQ